MTSLLIQNVYWDELVPLNSSKVQESKLQDPGKLKYSERATADANVNRFEVPEYYYVENVVDAVVAVFE